MNNPFYFKAASKNGGLKSRLMVASCVSALILTPNAAFAQDQAAPEQEETENQQSADIVVTAERREQSLQDIAATVKAVDDEDLRKLGVNSFTDLATVLPQLNIGNREGNIEIFIRGIGDDNNTELSEPRSAILLDDVYISRPRGLGSFFFDIERVELNIGPQGTVRGRNATGGSLNIVSARPNFNGVSGFVDFGIADFDQTEVQAALNIPISDTLAIRGAVYHLEHDSFVQNVNPLSDNRESDEVNDTAGRLSVLFEPDDRLSVLIVGDYLDQGGTGSGGINFFESVQQGGQDISDLNDIPNPRDILSRGSQPVQDAQIWGVRANISYEFDTFAVQYLGSFRSVDYFFNRSAANANFPGAENNLFSDPEGFTDSFNRVQFDTSSESIVQELRITANDDQRFRWNVGGFYYTEDQTSFFNTTSDPGNVFAGVEFAIPEALRDNFAFYADATYDVTEDFRITGGIRYTNEDQSRTGLGATYLFLFPTETDGAPPNNFNFSCCANHRFGTEGLVLAGPNRTIFNPDIDGDGNVTATERIATFLDGITTFGARDDIDDQLQLLLDEGPLQTGFDLEGREISSITVQDGQVSDEYVDWRVRAEYDISDDNLVYLSVSTGTNSGGFNDTFTGPDGNPVTPTFDRERLVAYEIGSKNSFFIGNYRSVVNLSAFYYDYSDQVFTTLAAVDGSSVMGSQAGLVSLRQNIGDSELYGFDIDYTQDLPLNLVFKANVQYLQTQFLNESNDLTDSRFNFAASPDETVQFDPVGNRLPKASDWSGSVSLSQLIETGIGKFDWVASLGFRSNYFTTFFNGDGNAPDASLIGSAAVDAVNNNLGSATDIVDGYVRLDVGVGFEPSDGFRIEGFVKNLTDQTYSQTSLVSPGLNLRFLNAPRQWGARVRYSF